MYLLRIPITSDVYIKIQSSVVSGHYFKTTLTFPKEVDGKSKAVSLCYCQCEPMHSNITSRVNKCSQGAAHVTQLSKSPTTWFESFLLKNSTVWGRREAQRTASKTKASEAAWKSFSEAAKVIQGKSLRIKQKCKNTEQKHKLSYSKVPFSSMNTESFIPTKIPFCLFSQYFLYKDSAFSLCWGRNGLQSPLADTWHDSWASVSYFTEEKLASILKYYLQNLNHLLGGICAGLREECEEEGEAKCYRLTTIPTPLQRKGEEVERSAVGRTKVFLGLHVSHISTIFFFLQWIKLTFSRFSLFCLWQKLLSNLLKFTLTHKFFFLFSLPIMLAGGNKSAGQCLAASQRQQTRVTLSAPGSKYFLLVALN